MVFFNINHSYLANHALLTKVNFCRLLEKNPGVFSDACIRKRYSTFVLPCLCQLAYKQADFIQ